MPLPRNTTAESSNSNSRKRPRQDSNLRRLSSEERKSHYDRIEYLTKELTSAIKGEMARRKEYWNSEGDREEEEKWESRKKDVYRGLENLDEEIQRALRDRKKEAVLELWGKEMEEKRALRFAEGKGGGE